MENTLESKCLWHHVIKENIRKMSIEEKKDLGCSIEYKNHPCLSCDGYKKDCRLYLGRWQK